METRQHGFTLWELLVTIAVAGILLGIAVPSFSNFQRSNAMAAAANDLVTGTLLARSEAVKRQAPVVLCITADPFADRPACGADQRGAFIVFVDDNGDDETQPTDDNGVLDDGEEVLLRSAAPGGRIRLFMESPAVTYGRNGFPRGAATRFLFCDDRGIGSEIGGRSAARVMMVDPTGRGTIRADVATVEATLAAIPGAECGS